MWVPLCLAVVSACSSNGQVAQPQPIRVLVVTATQGWRHGDAITASTSRLKQAASTSELQFDFTEDPSTLNAANLAKYDVVMFNNSTLRIAPKNPADSAARRAVRWPRTGDIASAVTRPQQEDIAAFVRDGKGLVAIHAGVDAFYGWPEYRDIVGGGLFLSHPFTREAKVNVEDQKNPAFAHFGPSVNLKEEYYYLDVNPRPVSHVLASLDLPSVNDTTKTDHPLAFIKHYGKGRVYVNVLGHFPDTWMRDDYLTSVLQGIRIAAGRLPADFGSK
jgi:type 1 glutamine amidotransferase